MLFYQKNFNLNCARTEIKSAFNFCTRTEKINIEKEKR